MSQTYVLKFLFHNLTKNWFSASHYFIIVLNVESCTLLCALCKIMSAPKPFTRSSWLAVILHWTASVIRQLLKRWDSWWSEMFFFCPKAVYTSAWQKISPFTNLMLNWWRKSPNTMWLGIGLCAKHIHFLFWNLKPLIGEHVVKWWCSRKNTALHNQWKISAVWRLILKSRCISDALYKKTFPKAKRFWHNKQQTEQFFQ